MNSAVLALTGLSLFGLGYKFYSRFLANKIYGLNQIKCGVPSHLYKDGLDFVPTKKHILFGHHFTSIAGAAPIIGPCIAAFWGWLPAFLWVVFGTIFIGAVHDFGALVISVREKGRSIPRISETVINARCKSMFLIFVLMLTWLVLAVFSMVIANLFVSVPTAVLPINIEILMALGMGWLIYKKKSNTLILSIIALGLLYVFIWVGIQFPLSFEIFDLSINSQTNLWITLLLIYAGIASLLPVWSLLQPRDFINCHQLIVGLLLIYGGLFIARPLIDAPMIRLTSDGAPPIFPFLFVTIACGAISGFHGLVSSGTTSKQIDKVKDTRFIGYGGMLGEGMLALASTLAAVAGIALVSQCHLPSIGYVEQLSWDLYYDSWSHATANKAKAFVLGGGAFIQKLGFTKEFAHTVMAVLVISFAATTLDTATRIQRFIITELAGGFSIQLFRKRIPATLLSILPALFLAMWTVSDPLTGESTQAGWVLWPIFGASNQMLAALTLLILCLYFFAERKPILPLFIPFVFITVITLLTLFIKAGTFIHTNLLLFTLNILLIGLVFWMLVEGSIAYFNQKNAFQSE
ncbi:MAG: carbon starvation protein A [Candidatus Marinimicrobia bacterium]|nr:carbon starvation protein A [Candidatus Neomarinimicrobiota bacterium]|tara:strand:- start:60939 stop:62669 length:1731 start_codon:yes stop_codon:yes gene_type:complete